MRQQTDFRLTVGIVAPRTVSADLLPGLAAEALHAVNALKAHLARLAVEICVAGPQVLVDHLAKELAPDVAAIRLRPVSDSGPDVRTPMQAASSPLAADLREVVERSHVLIALWDGLPPSTPTDVGSAIACYLGIGDEATCLDWTHASAATRDDAEIFSRLVYAIELPSDEGRATAPGAQRAVRLIGSHGGHVVTVSASFPGPFLASLLGIDTFLTEHGKLQRARGYVASQDSILSRCAHLTEPPARESLEPIDRLFVMADELARHTQHKTNLMINVYGVTGLVMGFLFLVYDKLDETPVFLELYVAVLAAGFVAYYLVRDRRWFARHLTYRALAESLRVQVYLALAGVDGRRRIGELFRVSGIWQLNECAWMGFVTEFGKPPLEAGWGRSEPCQRFVIQDWVQGQQRYFAAKVAQMEKARKRISRLKRVSVGAVTITLGLMIAYGESLHRLEGTTGLPFKNLVTFATGVLAVTLSIWELRQRKLATQELLWQYSNQLRRFSAASEQLESAPNTLARAAILRDLGESALMEVYLWILQRVHREFQPHH